LVVHHNLRPIASILLGVAFFLAGNGLLFTLLPLRGSAEGFSALALGGIGSSYYLGFVSGCLLAPWLIVRAGHIRAFAAIVALAAVIALAYPLAPQVIIWLPIRFINGFCVAGFYLVIESWLNDRATNANRGLIMSSYIGVNFIAFTVGQVLVTGYPVKQAGDFMLAAMFASLAIIPVALTRSAQPVPITAVSFRPGELYRAAPVGLVASFMIGAANGAFWGLGPLSAEGAGLTVHQVALFMGAATLAGAVMQWPVGRISDRIDRRIVLLGLLIAAALTGFMLWQARASGIWLIGLGLLFGTFTLPGYALAAAHAYDKTPSEEIVPTAATILLANALGSVTGPLIASMLMSSLGPSALFLFTAGVQALLAAFVFYRIKVKTALSTPEKTSFDLAATAPIGPVAPTAMRDSEDLSSATPKRHSPHGEE
jgi:MFS family permease